MAAVGIDDELPVGHLLLEDEAVRCRHHVVVLSQPRQGRQVSTDVSSREPIAETKKKKKKRERE